MREELRKITKEEEAKKASELNADQMKAIVSNIMHMPPFAENITDEMYDEVLESGMNACRAAKTAYEAKELTFREFASPMICESIQKAISAMNA